MARRSPHPSPAELAILDPDGAFRKRLAEDRAVLSRFASAGMDGEVERVVHQLAGAAGTFGFSEIGEIAIDLDDRLVAMRTAGGARPDIAPLLAALERGLETSA